MSGAPAPVYVLESPCPSCGAIEGQGCDARRCEAVSRGFREVGEDEYRRAKRAVLRHEWSTLEGADGAAS